MHNPLLLTLPTRMPLPHFCVSGWVLSPKSPVVIHIACLYPFNLIPQPVLKLDVLTAYLYNCTIKFNGKRGIKRAVRLL